MQPSSATTNHCPVSASLCLSCVTRVTRTAAGGYHPPHHFLGEAVFLHSKHASAPPHLCGLRLLTLPPFYSLYYSDIHHLLVPSYYENKNESSCCSFKTWRVSTAQWEESEGQSRCAADFPCQCHPCHQGGRKLVSERLSLTDFRSLVLMTDLSSQPPRGKIRTRGAMSCCPVFRTHCTASPHCVIRNYSYGHFC